jgi:hypothetical protein
VPALNTFIVAFTFIYTVIVVVVLSDFIVENVGTSLVGSTDVGTFVGK